MGSIVGPGRFRIPLGIYIRAPQLLSPHATAAEAWDPRVHAPSKEKPQKCEVHAPQLESSPHKSQLEKAHTQQQRPGATKNI